MTPSVFDDINRSLGLSSSAVPLPLAQQEPVVTPATIVAQPVARLPRPRPELEASTAGAGSTVFDQIQNDLGVPAATGGGSVFDGIAQELGAGGRPIVGAQPGAGEGEAAGPMVSEGAKAPLAGGQASPAPSLFESVTSPFSAAASGVARGFNRLQQAGPTARLVYPGLDPNQLVQSPEEARKTAVREFIEQGEQADSYKYSQNVVKGALQYKDAEDKGVWQKLKVLATNPDFTADVLGESLSSSIPSSVLGAVGGRVGGLPGAAGGIGAGSAVTEYTSSISDFLHDKKNVDLSDPEQVEAAFSNQEWIAEAKTYAAKRGTSVGAWDAITALVVPKIFRGISDKAGKIAAPVGGIATEAAGGAAGEATAQVVSEGKIVSSNDILLEAVGELAGGASELAIATISDSGGRPRVDVTTPPTATDVIDAFGNPIQPPPRVVSPEEAEAEGRTLFGFEDGSGQTQVGTYEEAERAMATKGTRNGRLVAIAPEQVEQQVDIEKVLNVPGTTGRNLTAVGSTPEENTRATELLRSALPEEKAELQGLLSRVQVQNPDRIDIYRSGFRGDTTHLGITPREIDYAGLDVDPQKIAAGEDLLITRNITQATKQDLDLKKITPGTLMPSVLGLDEFRKGQGEAALVELATAGGSTPEAIATMLSELRSGQATFGLRDAQENGTLKFKSHPGLFSRGAIVRDTPAARAEVQGAVVKAPAGKFTTTKGDGVQGGNNKAWIGAGAKFFRKASDTAVTFVDPYKSLLRVDPKVRQAMTAAVAAIDSLVKTWKLPFAVQVVATNSSQLDARTNAQFAWTSAESTSTIFLNMDNLSTYSAERVYSIIFHEFGHFISATGMWQLDAGTRSRVWAAYRRFLLTTSSLSTDEAASRQGTLGRTEGFGHDPGFAAYVFSFEEWFADQVSRWALTNRRPLGFVAKVVWPMARRLLQAAKSFEKTDPTNKFRAEPEIERFLAETLGGSVKAEWSTEMQKEHNRETEARNVRGMAGHDTGPVTPLTVQSVLSRQAVEKLGGDEALRGVANALGATMQPVGQLFGNVDRFNWFYKWALSLPQVAERNLGLVGLQLYRELIQLAQLDQSNIMGAAQDRLRQWRDLGKAEAGRLGQVLFDLTRMNYLTPAERLAGVVRQPTIVEFQALVKKYKLSRSGVQALGGIQQDFRAALDRYTDELTKAANAITDVSERANRLAEIQKIRKAILARPYFPMTRYGNWTVTVRDQGRLVHFETFESKRLMQQAFRAAQAKFPQGSGHIVQQGVLDEEARGLIGIPPQMLDMMSAKLNLSQAQRDAIEQLKFELSPAQSFKKRFLHRKEVAGWSEDAQRNFAHYMFHHAKHLVRVKYEGALREQVKAVRGERKSRGGDATKVLRIANFMTHHLGEFLNPKADMAALRSAAAVWYLGFVPQSAILNLTQLGFATAPFLSSKFGDLRTFGALRKATLDVRSFYKKDTIKTISEPEMQALSEAMEEGLIDESQAAELAALSEGNTVLGTDASRKWGQFTNAAMKMFQMTEQFNRRVTFRAAWKLAQNDPNAAWLKELAGKHQLQLQRLINRGWVAQDALAFLAGKDAVLSTQFEYAKYARPRFMQGRAGAIFMFYLFTQNMLFMLWNNPGTIPRYMLTMALIGGVMGLPGMDDADEIVKAIAARFGKHLDLELEARKAIVEITQSKWLADMVLRGGSRESFGIPALLDSAGVTVAPKIDMSKQIGMGRVLPINPAFLVGTPGVSQEKAVSQALQDNAGAAFGIGFNIYQAMTDTSTPFLDLKRWERAMPRSLKNGARAFRLLHEGQERDRGGATVVKFDSHDLQQVAEAISVAMGFNPTRLSREWDRRIATIEVQKFWEIRRELILGSMARAVREKDKDDRAAAVAAVRSYNQDAPRSMRISAESFRESVKRRLENVQHRSQGLPTRRAQVSVGRDVGDLFPTEPVVRPLRSLETTSQ